MQKKTTEPTISILPLDVGYDPLVLRIQVNLPPVDALTVKYIGFDGKAAKVSGPISKVRAALIGRGYNIAAQIGKMP